MQSRDNRNRLGAVCHAHLTQHGGKPLAISTDTPHTNASKSYACYGSVVTSEVDNSLVQRF